MINMKKRSKSYDQNKLKIVCDNLCENIDNLFSHLNLDYKNNGKMITMCCPIHGGDNQAAINIYPNGDTYRGNWKCRTHQCERVFKGSIIGFVRGVLSRQKLNWEKEGDMTCSFDEALEFCLNLSKTDMSKIKVSKQEKNKQTFANMVNNISTKIQNTKSSITRDDAKKTLEIPAKYFLDRGFSDKVLKKYDVGLCNNIKKEMYGRAVAPIYDNNYQYIVGCTGRSVFECCDKCKCFHDPNKSCPSRENSWAFSKWRHSKDFKTQNYLYNFWFAKNYIYENYTIILVESPGNVWKLEENNINNSVAMFGSSLSDRQKSIIDSSGAMNIVILTDNDEAGNKAADQIISKCKNTYRIFKPKISTNDIGDMSSDQIEKEIKTYLKEKNL